MAGARYCPALSLLALAIMLSASARAEAPTFTPRGHGERSPDTILVRFRDEASATHRTAHQRRVKAAQVKDFGGLVRGLEVWRVKKGTLDEALKVLSAEPDIAYAEPDYTQYALATPNDPRYGELWGLHNTGQTGGVVDSDIDAPEAWDIASGTSEVVVGVVDTGVDYNHEDLAANIWTNPGEIPGNGLDDDGNGFVDDVHGWNAYANHGNPMDDHDHGSHCSGTIGARGNNGKGVAGVNWDVKIMGLKFLSATGSGSTTDAIEAINYAVTMKNRGVNIRVLSNSWGGGDFSQALLDAINAAAAADILFVAAAGNSTVNTDTSPNYPSSYDAPNMLAVASTDYRDALSSFSNYGATTVDLGAPGSSILSTTPGNTYQVFSGTSMATPHVSGAAALLASIDPSLTYSEIKSFLMNNVDPIPALNGKCVTGGRLNVAKAVNAVGPPAPGFRLSTNPGSATLNQGQTTSLAIATTPTDGFVGDVTLSLSSMPALAGATVTFSTNPVAAGSSSTLTIATPSEIATGTYNLFITGVSGSVSRTAQASLLVDPEGTVTVTYGNSTVTSIPDNNTTGIQSTLNVPDSLRLLSTSLQVDITHPYIGDLDVFVVSPAGNTAVLHNRSGGSADNLHQTYSVAAFNGQNSQGTWTLKVRDMAGIDHGTLDFWSVTLKGAPAAPPPPDTTPPSVSLTDPANGATVIGLVMLNATASDDLAVTEVRFYVNGALLATDITAPFSTAWGSMSVPNGSHTLTAQASDAAGHVSTSAAVLVTVANDMTPPALSSVAAGSITGSSAVITWTTDEASDSQVQYGLTTSYGSSSLLDTARVTSHSRTLTGLSEGTTYHYRARSMDAAGNIGLSGDFTFTTPSGPDQVTLSSAAWSAAKRQLTIEGSCTSSTATLTATFGSRTEPVANRRGCLFKETYSSVTSNPGTVTVRSSGGGSATATVVTK